MSETNESQLKPSPDAQERAIRCPLIEVDFANSTALSTSRQRALAKDTFSASRDEFLERETPIIADGQLDLFGLERMDEHNV